MRRRRSRDAAALTAAIALHAGVFLLLLLGRQQAPPPSPPRRDLALFDVGMPPPPSPPEPTHRDRPSKPTDKPPGGSHATTASTIVDSAAAAPRASTLFPSQPRASSPIDEDGTSLLAGAGSSDAAAGRDGDGAGTGTGSGTGSGIGADTLRFGHAAWIRVPSIDDFRPYLPSIAPGQTIVVSVKLGCLVPVPGKPKRCWVVSENPPGFGIGRAAVKMSNTFRIRPVLLNDEPVDLPVMVPILLRISSPPVRQRSAQDAKKPGHR